MRRAPSFALVGLVAVATGIGAWLGVSSAPAGGSAQAWVAQVLATTRAAGTVRFTYASATSMTTSSDSLIRSSNSGSGALDFADDAARATEIQGQHGSSSSQIRLGRTVYIGINIPGQPHDRWFDFGQPSHIDQGLLGLEFTNASGALAGFYGPFHAVRVEDLGSAVVDGIPATGYRVISRPLCSSSRSGPPSDTAGPTELWVDGVGRLVQVRSTSSVSVRPPPIGTPSGHRDPGSAGGRVTTTGVIRFFGYGDPVTITAPPLPRHPLAHSAVTFAISAGC